MGNFIYDKLNDFGYKAGPLTAGSFPNVINLIDAKADRMTVDILADKNVAGGTSVTVLVQGCATEDGAYANIGTNTFSLADLKNGVCKVAISPNPYRYLKVTISVAGTFAGGGARALINSYYGK
jgi:hypothetical protein